jgi:hypothetical protein
LFKYQSRAGSCVVGLRKGAFPILLRICCKIGSKLDLPQRFIVRADEKLTAFVELESAIRG